MTTTRSALILLDWLPLLPPRRLAASPRPAAWLLARVSYSAYLNAATGWLNGDRVRPASRGQRRQPRLS